MNRSMPGLPVHHQLPEFTETHVHLVSDAIQPSHPLLSPSPPASIPPSIRGFSNESFFPWGGQSWSFSLSISPSSEYPGLVSFRMDWLDLLAVLGTLKSHHSSKASILQCSAFFTAKLSHPYVTTGETIALTRQTFVGKVGLCFLPRESHGQKSLAGYNPWGHKESDTTEQQNWTELIPVYIPTKIYKCFD